MAESVSPTDVKNAALALIGQDPITSQNDGNKPQRFSTLLYIFARNETFDLRGIDWRFAEARAQLAPYAVAPVFGSYTYQFILPSLCRRVRHLQETTDDDTQYKFRREVAVVTSGPRQIEYDVILANIATAYIRYTRLRTDTNRWPSYFTALTYTRLAIMLCEPLKQDKAKKNQLFDMYRLAFDEAKAGNGSEDKDVTRENTEWSLGNKDVIEAATIEEVDQRFIINRVTET